MISARQASAQTPTTEPAPAGARGDRSPASTGGRVGAVPFDPHAVRR